MTSSTMTYSEIQNFKKQLREYWNPDVERCGTDLGETKNHAPDPENFFEFDLKDLQGVKATWHTHPKTSPNLSIMDYHFFLDWPKLFHFIIGSDEVRCYYILSGIVCNLDEEEDYTPRLLEGSV